jgi:rod shape-determining protein MreC
MMLDHKQAKFVGVRTALSTAVSPIQYIADFPMKIFGAVVDNFTFKHKLIAENALLKTQKLVYEAELQKLAALESENAALQKLLSSSVRKNTKVLVGRVLDVDTEPFIAQMIIDQGKDKGVFIGQPVLDANGLLGQVIQVGPLLSRVMLITDTRSGVPVQVVRNGVKSIALGDGNRGSLTLQYLPTSVDIKEGDQLITSGLGGHYPPGYPVGEVLKIGRKVGEPFLQITMRPSANINSANLVLLIWPSDRQSLENAKQQLEG